MIRLAVFDLDGTLVNSLADKGKFGKFAYYCWAAGVLTLVLQGIK